MCTTAAAAAWNTFYKLPKNNKKKTNPIIIHKNLQRDKHAQQKFVYSVHLVIIKPCKMVHERKKIIHFFCCC